MPLKTSKSKSEKTINKTVSKNIEELEHNGSKPRSQKQIVAIAESAARGRSGKTKSTGTKKTITSSKTTSHAGKSTTKKK